MSEWISVEDRLPEYGDYIVCLENKAVVMMNFSDISVPRWLHVGVGFEDKKNMVTHWQYKPEPPK